MKFWDASAMISLCLDEPHSVQLRKVIEEDPAMVAWWAAPVECYSAFARLRRENALTSDEETQARQVLEAITTVWTEIEPSRTVREHAGRALLLHPLRAADSLQLAAALVWAKGHAAGHQFICLDHKLREAAKREGFTVIPPRL
jgi:predicted nucleic acid-binding protein